MLAIAPAVFLVVYVVSGAVALLFCREGWQRVELPPRFRTPFLVVIPRRLFFRECGKSRSLVDGVRRSLCFRLKMYLGLLLLDYYKGGRLPPWGILLGHAVPVVTALDCLLEQSKICQVRSIPPVGGYASWCSDTDRLPLLGAEQWIRCLPVLGRSAICHEMMHLLQQICVQVFDREWGIADSRLPYGQAMWLETHAHLVGSPLWITTVVAFFFSPVIIEVCKYF